MKNKEKIIKKIIIIVISICVLTIAYSYLNTNNKFEEPQNIPEIIPVGEPIFEWIFEDNTDNPDYVQTNISLKAIYENTSITKVVDTAFGSCNLYDGSEKDIYEKSNMILCYAAGLGHYYKIIKQENEYLIQRKIFEEASPEYTPQVNSFVTILVF